ncbi:MAG: hypothetical protein MI866_01950 [Bacteroidales bacterium]|nr:hypothetical protein [Bacteroidales bacterium]
MFKKLFKNKIEYKFKEAKNTACFVCDHVLNKEREILFVTHDKDDSSWQFLCGESDHTENNIKVISMGETVDMDNTINDLFEMPEGFGAEIKEIGEKWTPFKISD